MQNFIEPQSADVDFSIVIPVYNSEQSLPKVLQGVREVFASLDHSYEFVLVDDGSVDLSWQVIQQQHAHGDICAVRHMRNQGHSMALKHAMEFCTGEWVITMDDDLQHPPSELPKLIAAVENQPEIDVVMGSYDAKRDSAHKSLGAHIYQSLIRRTFSLPEDLRITSFRVINRRVVDELVSRHMANPHAGFMLLGITNNIINVPVDYHPRRHGQSGMTLSKSITIMVDALTQNSVLPLKIIGFGGIVMALIAALAGLYYLGLYLLGGIGVSGFITLVLLIIGFSGMILASIGVVGIYLMRLIQQTTSSPRYSLREYLPRAADIRSNELKYQESI